MTIKSSFFLLPSLLDCSRGFLLKDINNRIEIGFWVWKKWSSWQNRTNKRPGEKHREKSGVNW